MVLTNTSQMDAEHKTGLWLSEFAEPYAEFKKQGFEVVVTSPQGGDIPIDPNSTNEEEKKKWSEAIKFLQSTDKLAQYQADSFDGIFLPGGHGTMFDLPNDESLQSILTAFSNQDKAIAAVCHGPAGLVGAKRSDGKPLVEGKQVTAFTNREEKETGLDALMPFLLESKLRELGAHVETKENWADHVIVDGKLVTGQNPQSGQSAAEAFVKVLNQ